MASGKDDAPAPGGGAAGAGTNQPPGEKLTPVEALKTQRVMKKIEDCRVKQDIQGLKEALLEATADELRRWQEVASCEQALGLRRCGERRWAAAMAAHEGPRAEG